MTAGRAGDRVAGSQKKRLNFLLAMPTLRPSLHALRIMLASFASLAACTGLLAAEPYPSSPVRVIVPTQPGGSVDIVARLVAAELSRRLGKQVVVDNRGGAGGIIGAEMTAKAAADGYTLLVVSTTQSIQPALHKLPYEPVKSFSPIAKLASGLLALVVHPSVPAGSAKDFVLLARRKPGALSFAGTGNGSIVHMATLLFNTMASTDVLIVQYKSAGPAVIDLLGGHSHAMMGTISSVLPHIRSGKLKVLGTSGARRSDILPEVPTIAETALQGYEASIWYGIVAPADTPSPIIDRLNREIKAILALDEVRKMFLNGGVEADYLGPAEFGAFFGREMEQWARVVKKANITLKD